MPTRVIRNPPPRTRTSSALGVDDFYDELWSWFDGPSDKVEK